MAITNVERARVTQFALPRLSLETAAFLTLLLGAWAGLVSFVGPLFSFSGDGTGSWHWNLAHAMLFLAPGAVACLAGLLAMIGAVGNRRAVLGFSGLLAAVCGAWLVAGPVVWPVLEGGSVFGTGASALRELAYWGGYSLGPGALLIAFGAFILGRDRFVLQPQHSMQAVTVLPVETDSPVAQL